MSVIYQIIYNGERFDIVVNPDGDDYYYSIVLSDDIEGSDSEKTFTTILDAIYAAIDEICAGDESGKTILKRDIKLDEILNYEKRS
jgi:hypothetical protein